VATDPLWGAIDAVASKTWPALPVEREASLTRTFAQYVPLEMALLGLLELVLSYLLIYSMLNVPGTLESLSVASREVGGGTTALAAMLALTIGGTAAAIGLYRPTVCLDNRRLLLYASVTGALAFPSVAFVGSRFSLSLTVDAFLWLAKLLAIWLTGILISRLVFNIVLRQGWLTRRVLIVGSGQHAEHMREKLRESRVRLFEPVVLGGDISALSRDRLRQQRIWGVVIAASAAEPAYDAALLDSKLRGVRVFNETSFHERQLGRVDVGSIDASWLLYNDGFAAGRLTEAVKRAGDVLISATLLLLTLPLMLVTALLIKLGSPGPVFYRQLRCGRFGKPFTLIKFRSMMVDAEAGGKPRWAQKHDPRATRVGAIIRSMRIDELPQLINVLRGDMSMVGPRPERPHFVEQLARVIPFYHERSYVTPGITGWAQINFPYGASVEDAREKLAYDLYYVKHRNLLLDILILFATIRVILFREGAR
jgi:sugar transferase (PEP-CTERM system associated)